jgi:Tol biopolymer transport system component
MRMRGILTLIVAGVLLSGPAVEPAAAAFPGRPGHIAFSRSGTGSFPSNADIWVSNRDGGNQRRLTSTARADETHPVYSPNGRLILFVRRKQGDADIWVMRADGSNQRRLTFHDDDEFQPSFYPSGRSFLFTRFDGSRGWTIYSQRLRPPLNLKLVQRNATFPIVSPNGRWFAYSATQDGIGGIRLENRRSGRTRRLTTGSAQGLDFSPNSHQIIFTGQRHCSRGNSDLRFALLKIGVRDRRSAFLKRSCRREFINAAWSPNGRKIVFTHKKLAFRGSGLRFRLGIMLPDGTQVGGAPHHRRGTSELDPSWQPLRRR